MDADPNPVTTDVPTDEHISLFLRHARRCAEDTATGLAVDIAPPDTSTGIVIGPTPGVATPVVVVGPTTDGDFGTADGALPYDDDFDPIIAGSDRDEVTAVAPDGADLEPTSPDLTSTRGGDTTAAMPVGTGRVVDGVSDGGFGTDDFADEVLSDDVVDFDPHSAWDGGDEVTAALPDGAHRLPLPLPTTHGSQEERRGGSQARDARDARKRQRGGGSGHAGSAHGHTTRATWRHGTSDYDRAEQRPEGRGGRRRG